MALSREEKLALLQGGSAAPSGAMSRDQKLALLRGAPMGGQEPAPESRLRDDVTFAGSERAGRVASGLFPRAAEAVAEGKGYGSQVMASGLDLLSLPGRALAGLGREDGESYLNSVADQEGESFAGRVLRDPGTGAAVLTAPLGGLAAGALGRTALAGRAALAGGKAATAAKAGQIAAAGGVEGAASAAAHQVENVQEGRGVNLGEAALETGTGALLAPAGAAAGKAIGAAGKFANKQLGRLAQELSGVEEDALRYYGTGFGESAKVLGEYANKQHEIGQKLVDAVNRIDEYLPEKDQVNAILSQMPPVRVENAVRALEEAKTAGRIGSARKANAKIDEIISDIQGLADPNGNISAQEYRALRMDLDTEIGDAWGKESNAYLSALKQARHQMAQDLVDVARSSGNSEFETVMASMRDKLRAADRLRDFLGRNATTQENRAESFVANLFGKNKTERQQAVQALGDIFGQDFLEQARLANLGAQFGETGKPGLLPRQFTGRALIGPGAAGAVYGATGGDEEAALPFLALSSPRLVAATLSGANAAGKTASAVGSGLLPAFRYSTRTALFKKKDEE